MKLNALHFLDEINKIMEEDLLSPSIFYSMTQIDRGSVSKWKDGTTKTIQMDTAKKVAVGTKRNYSIKGDKIYYYKDGIVANIIKDEDYYSNLTVQQKELFNKIELRINEMEKESKAFHQQMLENLLTLEKSIKSYYGVNS